MAALLLHALPAQADYLLQQGDKIRFAIAGVPQSETISTVDLDGRLHFPRLGSFNAVGRTLAELRSAISVAAAGKVIEAFTGSGQPVEIALDGTEIFVELSEYRPIYVSGDVAAPGEVAFQPGLTVRTAIASAGGPSAVSGRFKSAALDTPDLQADIRSLSLSHTTAVIRRWGIASLLARDLDRAPPELSRLAVSREVFEETLASERDIIANALDAYHRERAATRERLELLSSRLDRLSEKLGKQQAALALADKDLERIKGLRDRGLAAESRVSDARRSLLLVSTRVLSVQDSIAQLELQKQELEQQLAASKKEFETPLMKERQEVSEKIRNTASQLAAARNSLELYGLASRAAGGPDGSGVAVELVRTVDGETKTLTPDLDAQVLPGDVVDVTLRYNLPGALIGQPLGSNHKFRDWAPQVRPPDAATPAGSIQRGHRPAGADRHRSGSRRQAHPSVTAGRPSAER